MPRRATGCAPRRPGTPGQRPGQELAVRQHHHPGPKHPVSSRSRARACSLSRYGPRGAASRLPVPDSAAASHRTCANASRAGWRREVLSFGGCPAVTLTYGATAAAADTGICRSARDCSTGPAGAGPSLPRPAQRRCSAAATAAVGTTSRRSAAAGSRSAARL